MSECWGEEDQRSGIRYGGSPGVFNRHEREKEDRRGEAAHVHEVLQMHHYAPPLPSKPVQRRRRAH